MSVENIINESFNEISSKKPYLKESRINKQLAGIRNLFYGLLIFSSVFVGSTYFYQNKIKNDVRYKIKTEISKKINDEIIREKIKHAVYKKVDSYISENPSVVMGTFRNSFDSILDIFVNEIGEDLKVYTLSKIDKKSKKWFEEEKKTIQNKNKRILNNIELPQKKLKNYQININETEIKSNDNNFFFENSSFSRVEELSNIITEINSNLNFLIYVDKNSNETILYDLKNKEVVNIYKITKGKKNNQQGSILNVTPAGYYNLFYTLTDLTNSFRINGSNIYMKLKYTQVVEGEIIKTRTNFGFKDTNLNYKQYAIDQGKDVTNGSIVMQSSDIKHLYNSIKKDTHRSIFIIEDINKKLNPYDFLDDLFNRGNYKRIE